MVFIINSWVIYYEDWQQDLSSIDKVQMWLADLGVDKERLDHT
jgi:hypothetical protein